MDAQKVDTSKMIAFLKEKWKGQPCPLCKHPKWSVGDSVFELRQFHGGNLVLAGPIVPAIPIICENCGYIALINAIKAGAVDPVKLDQGGQK